ncbi:PREDICTED: WAT1-related protein At1g25270-like [Tarenaya hassleriana]|uniref:WAT1-related protein At1g25270-like n=1 Tax=Tarenaya hassleriana TaxID=28532 RepID=UPI00053C67B3|nr:PREDICTED: WAT1-related protein At1g25270-like [Tarenaya hassleriana]
MVGRIWEMGKEARTVIAMVMVQVAYAGMNILFRLATDDGMDQRILVTYRLLFATFFTLPIALIFERKKRPKFTWRLLLLAFVSGLIGGALPNTLYVASLALTSATFSSAAGILMPLFTFVLAAAFRMESVRLRSNAGRAKVVGTLLGVSGTLVFILYKGFEIHIWSTHVDLLHGSSPPRPSSHHGPHSHLSVLGALLGLGSNLSYSLWLLFQAKVSKQFGGHYWNTSLMCVMATLVSVLFAACTDRHWNEWRLGWNIRLLSAAYSGIVVSGTVVAVTARCVELKGPLFVSIFSPVSLVIVALVGSFALDETLHLGSIIGTVMIVGGVYTVLWGKMKEMKSSVIVATTTSSDQLDETNNVNKDDNVNNLSAIKSEAP